MKNKSIFSKFSLCAFFVLIFSVVAFLLASKSKTLAEHLNFGLSDFVRKTLAAFSNLFPFSVFVFLILMLPLLIFLSFYYIFRAEGKAWSVTRRFLNLTGIIAIIFSLYIITVGIPNNTSPVYSKIGNFEDELEDGDVEQALEYITFKLNENYCNGAADINSVKQSMADALCEILPSADIDMTVKKPLIYKPLTNLGILAVYSFPTGEINLNKETPEFLIPITLAHEYMHLLGASGEADADFTAFLALSSSDDMFARYSAYISAFTSLIHLVDNEERNRLIKNLDSAVIDDLNEYNVFLAKRGKISAIGEFLNRKHTDIYAENGQKDYSFTAVLTVNYIKKMHSA